MQPFSDTLAEARILMQDAEDKVQRLREIAPYLIDMSLRENPVGAGTGQTLEDKLRILPLLREFGMRNILLGSLDYAMPDEPEVDDDFMAWLRDHDADMNGCFAFTDTGRVGADGVYRPSPSEQKLKAYAVPNTLHEIYLSDAGMLAAYGAHYSVADLQRDVVASIAWLGAQIVGDDGGAPRILINIVDGFDAIVEDLERSCVMLHLLAGQALVEGVSIEDDRGTYMPFQVGAMVDAARRLLPAPKKLLVHVHGGAGFENAAVIEALLRGADGVWGGLTKQAALIGHASLGELIANLVRAGNPHMAQYQLHRLLPLTDELARIDTGALVPDDVPVLGRNAYRLTLDFFRQTAERFMDLVPERIGGRYGYRICPIVSDVPVIAGRLAEVTGEDAARFTQPVCEQMIRLMRRDLRGGLRIPYDQPDELVTLYRRALTDSLELN